MINCNKYDLLRIHKHTQTKPSVKVLNPRFLRILRCKFCFIYIIKTFAIYVNMKCVFTKCTICFWKPLLRFCGY